MEKVVDRENDSRTSTYTQLGPSKLVVQPDYACHTHTIIAW